MQKNLILCSTGCFIGTKNNFDHTLIAKLKPKLVYHGFEIFAAHSSYASKPEEYEAIAEIVIKAKDDGCLFYSMHMNKNIGEMISRNENDDIKNALKLFESDCHYAVRYGVKLLVLDLWGGLPSDKNYCGSITYEHNFTQESDYLLPMLNNSFEFIANGISN